MKKTLLTSVFGFFRKHRKLLWMMRNLFVFLFVFSLQGHSSIFSQSRMTVDLQNSNMKELIHFIEQETSLGFLYDENLEDVPVSIHAENETIEKILEMAVENSELVYEIDHNIILIRKEARDEEAPDELEHLRRQVKGKVVDKDGNPIPGVNVLLLSLRQGVATDNIGTYSIYVNNDKAYELSFRYIGMEEQTITLNPKDVEEENLKTIVMQVKQSELSEVLVTGIFDRPKESFTGAATVVTKEQIKVSAKRNLLQTLANIDPSFDVQEQNNFGSDPNNQNLSIQIRGASSIPDVNNMQLAVRSQLNTPLFILDGFEVSLERVLDMNQNDVESVSILKDASATAIYGSRGANGVVVITSSRPPLGRLRVSYSAGVNLEVPDFSSYNLMNSTEKLAIEESAGLYSSDDVNKQLKLLQLYNTNKKAVTEGVSTDWLELPTRVGVGQYHRIGLGGGDAQFRYDMNLSYNQITGAMKGSKRDNINAGVTLQYLFKNIKFSNMLELGFNNAENSPYGQFSAYYQMNPYWRPYNEDGTPVKTFSSFGGQVKYNPLYDASLSSFSRSDYSSVRNQTTMTVNISPELKWDVGVGVTQLKGGTDYFRSPLAATYFQTAIDLMSRGSYTQGTRKESSYQASTTLSYGKTFGKHMLFLGANAQLMESHVENQSISVKGFTNQNLNDISNGISYSGSKPTFLETTTRNIGVTGNVNYSYDDRYFLDCSLRMDGASSFGSQNRFAPFYSVGAAWDASKESFFEDILPFIGQFKLRYSYGVTGSLNFTAYQALTTYKFNTDKHYNGIIGMNIMALGNEDLKWQNTFQHNFGVDISAFNGRLGVAVNYYNKFTDNLIGKAALPYSNGYTTYTENFGSVRNTGLDGQVSINALRIPEEQISWYIRLGAYHNTNVLEKLSEAIRKANEEYERQNFSGGTYYQYREGESLDELYVLKSPGVDPLTGEVLYEDPITHKVSLGANSVIRKIAVGNAQPKVNARVGSSLRYKKLLLDFTFNIRYGAKKLNNSLLLVENSFVVTNMDRRVLGTRWVKEGDITAFKSIAADYATYPNDRFVFTEKTISLSNVSLNYQFPQKLIKPLKIQQMTFGASIADVFYLSNIKTERGIDYPYAIRPTFNLSMTF